MSIKTVISEENLIDAQRRKFKDYVQNVNMATKYVYNARDDEKNELKAIKIIQDPFENSYMGVYHILKNECVCNGQECRCDNMVFSVVVAISNDLQNWNMKAKLAKNAINPYIISLSPGFLVAWEKLSWKDDVTAPQYNHLHFAYYPDRASLLNGQATRHYDAPVSLSMTAEGSPNIYSATLNPDIDHSVIEVGAHFYDEVECRDRLQKGTLIDFNTWRSRSDKHIDAKLNNLGVNGSTYSYDVINFGDYNIGVFEGELIQDDPDSWRLFCHDFHSGEVEPLNIITHHDSISFRYPRLTKITTPNGKSSILVSVYIQDHQSAKDESGELIFYRVFD
uniref:Uncharacterized protein n=1 Tax=Acrobeloides nanus TaxID=290746 RepID=A0A914CJY8_9BILA